MAAKSVKNGNWKRGWLELKEGSSHNSGDESKKGCRDLDDGSWKLESQHPQVCSGSPPLEQYQDGTGL